MSELRIIERFDGKYWITCRMKDIKKGDRFRLAESTGDVVTDDRGRTTWTAADDAYLDKGINKGVWVVNVQECT